MKKSKQGTYKGQDFSKEIVLTKPNEAMELEEILQRFIRNEPLQIGHDVNYGETEDDIEKLQYLDPVDKMKYIRKMQDVQNEYQKQELERIAAEQAAEREKFLAENREKWEREEAEKDRTAETQKRTKREPAK